MEILLLRPVPEHPSRRPQPGSPWEGVEAAPAWNADEAGSLEMEVVERRREGFLTLAIDARARSSTRSSSGVKAVTDSALPGRGRRGLRQRRYQTVYARHVGSVARAHRRAAPDPRLIAAS